MILFPLSFLGRVLCVLWLAACATLLLDALWERNTMPDTDIVFALSMITLTFPIGYGLGTLAGFAFLFLYKHWGIVVPGGFLANAISWIILVLAGYFQWFVLIPWLYRKAKTESQLVIVRLPRN